MYNDEPTLRDRLRRDALIKEVGDAIATCEPPQVFGVHGDWGLGKTSFLHQVRYHLTGDNPQSLATQNAPSRLKSSAGIRAVWFDAWRYHAEAVPVVALLQEMRAQLSSKALKGSAAKRLGEIAVKGTLLGLDELTKKIGFQYAKFQQASRQWDAENLAATLPSETLRQNLQETIRLLLPDEDAPDSRGGASRLVVFVDDLDRCEPEAAYRLLEGLKVYLTLNNCVFVLGLNQKAVEGAIASRLAGGLTDENARKDAQVRAASYLEKICQNVWHLPVVQAPGQLLCEFIHDDLSVDEPQVRWLREVVEARPCLPPNPRKLKGLANLVVRLCSRLPNDIYGSKGDEGRNEMRKLLVVAYVHQFHHELYVRWQANPDVYRDIARWCRGEAPELDILSGLKLPVVVRSSDESTDTEVTRGTERNTFPDPAAADVFWIQEIVRGLPDQLLPDTFAPYFERKAA